MMQEAQWSYLQNRQKINGFTLTEVMIAILIVSILAILAVNIYSSYVRAGRRADGMNTITSIALAEEKYRTTNLQYGTLAQVWGGVTSSAGGYYNLAISGTSATAYTITATAQGDQANDQENGTSCATLTLAVSNGTVTKTPAACWPQ